MFLYCQTQNKSTIFLDFSDKYTILYIQWETCEVYNNLFCTSNSLIS